MTDLVKRATPRAADLSRRGVPRRRGPARPAVRAGCSPAAVCFVGLAGLAGRGRPSGQRGPAGPRRSAAAPSTSCPRTSGLNAATPPRRLDRAPPAPRRHLTERSSSGPAAWACAWNRSTSTCTSWAPSPTSTRACTSTCTTRPGAGRRLVPLRQPGQRGLRRDDRVPLPARRPGRLHVQAAGDRRQRRVRRRRHPLRRGRAVRAPRRVLRRQGRRARRPAADGRPQEGLHGEPVRRVRGPHRLHAGVGHVRRRARRAAREAGRGVRQRATTSSSSRARASIRVGDEEWEIDGFGLRDHSWGPRYWQAPWYYRWLTANFGADFGFMGSRVARRDGRRHPRRLRVGGRQAPPLQRLRDHAPSGRATTATTSRSPRPCGRATRSGRSPARCST